MEEAKILDQSVASEPLVRPDIFAAFRRTISTGYWNTGSGEQDARTGNRGHYALPATVDSEGHSVQEIFTVRDNGSIIHRRTIYGEKGFYKDEELDTDAILFGPQITKGKTGEGDLKEPDPDTFSYIHISLAPFEKNQDK